MIAAFFAYLGDLWRWRTLNPTGMPWPAYRAALEASDRARHLAELNLDGPTEWPHESLKRSAPRTPPPETRDMVAARLDRELIERANRGRA